MVRQKKNGRKAPNDSAGDFPRHNHPVFRCEKCLFVRAALTGAAGCGNTLGRHSTLLPDTSVPVIIPLVALP